jgi:diacylglycerol kinase (ATP)
MHDTFALLLNPVAGKGKALGLLPQITAHMDSLTLEYKVFLTEETGHAERLAREASANGFSVVIAAGGDGTCNEVINGLMQCREVYGHEPPAFAVLPVGRGNDFAYGAGIPHDLPAACDVFAENHRERLDVGFIKGGFFPEGRFFGNGIGIGFDTIVGLRAARHKHLHGAFCYMAGALETLVFIPDAPGVEISYNGASFACASHQISILNGRRMGGAFFMAPDSIRDDGLLDLCMINRPITRRQMMGLISHYTKGTQRESPFIRIDRSPAFAVRAECGGLVCHADGETVCVDGSSLDISCVPSALTLVCKAGLPEPIGRSAV